MKQLYEQPQISLVMLSSKDILLDSDIISSTPVTDPDDAGWSELKPLNPTP